MLTRGKLIGDIMDGLGHLNFVLQTRSKLGLYDLNKYCEDFIKELLNLIYGYNLVNLNETRSNEPGLDLGDESHKLGIQVTTDKKTAKINYTLEKISPEQRQRYDRFVVLILGAKQNSYNNINLELAETLGFREKDDIWDFVDLERDIVSLPLDQVKQIFEFLDKELIRVFSDLDVGTTPSGESTSMLDRLETRPVNTYIGCESLVAYTNKKYSLDSTPEDMDEYYRHFYKQLVELPRITREFYFAVLSRSEYFDSQETYGVRDSLLRRVISISAQRFNEEVRLLEAYDLSYIYQDFSEDYWILLKGTINGVPHLVDMIEYINDKGFDKKRIFVDLEFSYFN